MSADLRHTEEFEGFTIRYYREEEDTSPVGQFMLEDGSDDLQLLHDINTGKYDWFCVRVTASKAGIELATEYFGGCCYESFEDFLTPDGYAFDIRSEAVTNAKLVIAKLCEGA